MTKSTVTIVFRDRNQPRVHREVRTNNAISEAHRMREEFAGLYLIKITGPTGAAAIYVPTPDGIEYQFSIPPLPPTPKP